MNLAKKILADALPHHLLTVLQQTIADIETLGAKRAELVQQYADATGLFKKGDVIIGDNGKALKIERVVGKEKHQWKDGALPEIEVFYRGRFILKDGALGKDHKDTQWHYTMGGNVRLAKPDEYPKSKAKSSK